MGYLYVMPRDFLVGKHKEVRARNSSAAIRLWDDRENEIEFYLYDRKTRLILGTYQVHLWKSNRFNFDKIKKKRKKKIKVIKKLTFPNKRMMEK